MNKWRYLLIAGVLVFSMACGLVDTAKDLLPGGNSDSDTPMESSTDSDASSEDVDVADGSSDAQDEDTPTVGNGDGDEEDSDLTLDEDALSELDSYRARLNWTLTRADGTGETMRIEQAATRDPQAYSYVLESDGEEMEMIQIGSQTWLRFGDDWISSSSDDMSDSQDFGTFLITAADMDVENWEKKDYTYLGKETINGIRTRHYQADYNEFWAGILAQEQMSDVQDAKADFWVADESALPKFMVKMTISVKGKVDNADAEWTLEQEVYDINKPFTIEEPEGVTSGLPDGVPDYPNAKELTTFGGMITFSTSDSSGDVADFYVSELEKAGWTQEEFGEMGSLVTASYTKDGTTLSLTITSDDEGTTTVLMMIEE